MPKRLAAALIAIPAALAVLAPVTASSQICLGPFGSCPRDPFNDPFNQNSDRQGTLFDLGVDVSNVPLTRTDVNRFLVTLGPDGQRIMVTTCRNYLGNPSQVVSGRTIEFCRVVLSL